MTATLELRAYEPTNFDDNNPNPRFIGGGSTPSDWTVIDGTYNNDWEWATVSGSPVKVETTVGTDSIKAANILGFSGSADAVLNVYRFSSGSETLLRRAELNAGYFLVTVDLEGLNTTNKLRFEINDTEIGHLHEIILLSEAISLGNMYDSSNGYSFISDNINLFLGFEDDSGDLKYNSGINTIPPESASYTITRLPTFTGTFHIIRTVEMWITGETGWNNNTTNSRLWVFEEHNDDGFGMFNFSNQNPQAMSTDEPNGTGGTVYSFTEESTASTDQIQTMKLEKLQFSTVSGDTPTPLTSSSPHELSRGDDLTSTTEGAITHFASFPDASTNPISLQIQTHDNVSEIDTNITLHFRWDEIS